MPDISDLRQRQALPLGAKVHMSQARIREWYDHWNGNVYYKIYVPKGTKAIYTEPQSHFGASMGGRDKIYQPGSSYSGVNSEAEVVIQRGTTYRITGIRRSGSDYHVEMEVVEQPDYFKYGDEDTYNDGKTRHKK